MKWNEAIILIAVLAFISVVLREWFPKKIIERETIYKKGETVVIDSSYFVDYLLGDYIVKADTVKNDSSHFITAHGSFELSNDSISVSGDVFFTEKDSSFSFSNVLMKGIERLRTETRVDTMTVVEVVTVPFYSNGFFWAALVSTFLLLLILLR